MRSPGRAKGEARTMLLDSLQLPNFRQRFPWIGPDLQTLRDTLRAFPSRDERGETLWFLLPEGDRLLARLDHPGQEPCGLVVLLHGLGGGSDAQGPRRLGRALNTQGFAVIRLNLRGAGPGRNLAKGTYAARCNPDLLPVFQVCQRLAREWSPHGKPLPLAAVGISLGGTVLLNALLGQHSSEAPPLRALACISSPLDLPHCSHHFEQPRNRVYQRWLVTRLIAETLADSLGVTEQERERLTGADRPRTIRAFDALITAPRWGFADVSSYYQQCSPLLGLRERLGTSLSSESPSLPPLLLVHSKDDPWVPVDATLAFERELDARRSQAGPSKPGAWPEVVITQTGGHNGFHAPGDSDQGCWSDRLVSRWLRRVLAIDPA